MVINLSGRSIAIGFAVLFVGFAVLAVLDAVNSEDLGPEVPESRATMRTTKGENFLTSIRFAIQDRDQDRAISQCDWGYEHLGKSRDNDEINDWLEIIDACNEAVTGNWSEARSLLP